MRTLSVTPIESPSLGGRVGCYGSRIRQAREKNGLTQLELAVKAGVTPATICRLERAHQTPHLSTVIKIADALGVEVKWVVG